MGHELRGFTRNRYNCFLSPTCVYFQPAGFIYFDMQIIYVNTQLIYIDMQFNYVGIQLIRVDMQDKYVDMQKI